MRVFLSQIEDTVTVCPYCMKEVSADDYRGHCGESNAHFEAAYVVGDELVLVSEAMVINDEEAL